MLLQAATAFAQWGSEDGQSHGVKDRKSRKLSTGCQEPLPGSAASLKTLATAVRERLQPEGKKGAEGPDFTETLHDTSVALSSALSLHACLSRLAALLLVCVLLRSCYAVDAEQR